MLQPDVTQDWLTLNTPHFQIHYQPEHHAFALDMASLAEGVHARLSPWLKWTPKAKTQIVINDSVDDSNGAATPLPYNRFFIYMNAPVDGELMDQTGWIEQVFTHEYTHLLHHDQVSGTAENVRDIFGRGGMMSLFAFPELFAPHWSSEGIAIYAESMNGFGRNYNATYEAKMRQEVYAGLRSYSAESYEGYNNSRWPFGQVYLYGAYFYQFIEDTYGKDKVVEYITNYNANVIPWRMDQRAKRTFGLSAENLWKQFQAYLTQRFEPQITKLLPQQSPAQALVTDPYLNQFLTATANDAVIFYHNDMITQPEIRQVTAQGEQTVLLKLDKVIGLEWHDQQGLLIQRSEVFDNTRVGSDLYLFNVQTQKLQRLTHGARLPRAVWMHNGEKLLAVQVSGGQTQLLELSLADLKAGLFNPKILVELKLGEALGDLSVAPNGQTIIASVKRPKTGWQLEALNLTTLQWQALTQNAQKPRQPKFSADGLSLYYIGDAENGHQVELYYLAMGSETAQPVTQSLGYVVDFALNPSPKFQDVWLTQYSRTGQQIALLKPQITTPSNYAVSLTGDLPNFNRLIANHAPALALESPQPYQPLDTLKPVGWTPFWSAANDYTALGALLTGQDVLGFHRWAAMPTLTFLDNQTLGGGSLSYDFYNRLMLSASQTALPRFSSRTNRLVNYDAATRFQMLAHYPKNTTEGTLEMGLGLAQETVDTHWVDYNLVQSSQNQLVGGTLQWNNVHLYPHGISVTDGYQLNLTLENYVGASDHQGVAGIAELAGYFDLGKGKVLKLAGLLGQGDDGIKPFQLGGNLDSLSALGQTTQLGKREFYLRGYNASSALQGTWMERGTLELRFPLTQIYDGGSVFPIGVGKVYGKVFADSGRVSSQGQAMSDFYTGVGFELSAEALIGFDSVLLPLTLGVAQGLDKNLGDQQVYVQLSLPL
ncbi:hypothetical protein THMIRHAT_10810 [Thiosulfativibrio zosterae]|uniref:Bacterial surface antigen (D15) domain-containing protein n=1 Tax=Thiosulfativibrio zosterae TaxID=2675053 RepID=A0A6F8PML6_9GAMM|nr:hypothetical protein THMIRHAT_10810 [Thiosulfativibrio zosterae]